MKAFRSFLLSLSVLSAVVSGLSINPDPATLDHSSIELEGRTPARCSTNAECLRNNQSLLKPRRRSNRRAPPQSSPKPLETVSGNLYVTDASTGNAYGYLLPAQNSFGEYGQFTATTAGALILDLSIDPTQLNEDVGFGINSVNQNGYPYFAAIVGFANSNSDFSSTSYNYAYLGGSTSQFPAGSPASASSNSFTAATGINEPVETAIFTYDPVSGEVTATWINTNGDRVPAFFVYANDDNKALTITGSPSAFDSAFGASYPTVRVYFRVV